MKALIWCFQGKIVDRLFISLFQVKQPIDRL